MTLGFDMQYVFDSNHVCLHGYRDVRVYVTFAASDNLSPAVVNKSCFGDANSLSLFLKSDSQVAEMTNVVSAPGNVVQ